MYLRCCIVRINLWYFGTNVSFSINVKINVYVSITIIDVNSN